MEPVTRAPVDEDWGVLASFLPGNWQQLAAHTGALRGLRKDKSPENLLRTLLIHLGMRALATGDRCAGAPGSPGRFVGRSPAQARLRKSRDWLYALVYGAISGARH